VHSVQLSIDDNIFNTVMDFLKQMPKNQLNIEIKEPKEDKKEDGLDFAQFGVESFKNFDGLEYQQKIRNEW